MGIRLNGKKKLESRVAWPSISRGGGNLDERYQNKIRELLNDFGIILEKEANRSRISIFVFPLFREFNLVGALTSDEVVCAIAPNVGGLPTFSWLDWQVMADAPKGRNLANAVSRELGWRPVSTLAFPRSLLDMDFEERTPFLRKIAKQWVEDVINEAERQARLVKLRPIFKGRDFLVEPDLCFVLMPFREQFLRIYEDHIKSTLEEIGLRVLKSDDLFTTTEIIEDIWEYINKAKMIVADVTGRNGNVFYELGLAHTVGKPVIILTQDESDVPFDLRHLRFFKYTDNEEGWKILKENLKKAAMTILEE